MNESQYIAIAVIVFLVIINKLFLRYTLLDRWERVGYKAMMGICIIYIIISTFLLN